MSDQLTVGELVYKISGDMENLKTELKKAETEVTKLKDSMGKADDAMKKTDKTTGSFTETMKKFATGLGLLYLTKLVIDFGKASLQAFANAQNSLIQYNNAEENLAGTTKEQINNLNDYVYALEKKTSVDDKVIRQGAQILAQDQISIDNQKKLLAGIVDLAVANSKANGGQVDAEGTARAIGRVISTGDTGILTRQNVVVDAKTAAAIKATGDETKRTALLMKVLEDNAKGAGEALGSSWQGKLNRAKDVVEDLQVATGHGLAVALTVLSGGLSDTVSTLGIAGDSTRKLGTAFVWLAGLANFVINFFVLMGKGLFAFGKEVVGESKVIYGFGKDVIGVFGKVGTAIKSVGSAMGDFLTGNFAQAKEDLKAGFDFSGVFDNTSKAMQQLKVDQGESADAILETTRVMGDNLETMATAGEVYDKAAAQQDELTKAKDATAKATQKETQATDEAKKALSDFQNKMVDAIQKAKDVQQSLGEDLTKTFKEFTKNLKAGFQETDEGLAKIVVSAEGKIKDLKEQLSKATDPEQQTDLQKQIAEQQKILNSRVGFETRQATEVAAIRKRLEDAGIDTAKSGIDQLLNAKTLQQEIDEQRKNATLDEFALFEKTQNQKLDLLATNLIAEVGVIKSKIDKEKKYEEDLTTFLSSENGKRLKDVDLWAKNTIAKYGDVASSLRNIISLQSQVKGFGGVPVTPAPPTSTPSGTGSSVSNSSKVVNSPITINASVNNNVDLKQVLNEAAWEMSLK